MSRLLWRLVNGSFPEYRRMSRFIERYVGLSPEEAARQNRKLLYRYLTYCRTYSPYWRKRWPKEAETFQPEEAEDVLAMLPPLTKTALREHREELRIRPSDRKPADGFPPIGPQREVRTGGSTGTPVLMYTDTYYRHRARATADFFYRVCGLQPGDPFFYLWGSNNEISDLSANLIKQIASSLRGLHLFPAFGLTPEKTRSIAQEMSRRNSVKSALCFASALDTFLSYAEREGMALRRLERVFTGGGMMYQNLRRRIEKYLATEVFDTYGSRDFSLMAFETPAHDGLSVASWLNHLEVLDGQGRRLPPGSRGEIHVTAIWNYSFALIRATTGDMAKWHPEPGRNKLPVPRISELSGRTTEHLRGPGEVVIDPSAVIHMIGVVIAPPWLRKFQLAQRSLVQFELRVESWKDEISDELLENLRSRVQAGLSKLVRENIDVTIVHLSAIPVPPSGKHLYCVQCFDSAEAGGSSLPLRYPEHMSVHR